MVTLQNLRERRGVGAGQAEERGDTQPEQSPGGQEAGAVLEAHCSAHGGCGPVRDEAVVQPRPKPGGRMEAEDKACIVGPAFLPRPPPCVCTRPPVSSVFARAL